jgi:hypothetical protein
LNPLGRFLVTVCPFQSRAVGVGNNEDSKSPSSGTGVGSSEHSPSRIHPQVGQVSENSAKPPRSECWRVFHERPFGLSLANDSGHLGPQSRPFAVDSGAASGDADILTGESTANDIDAASPSTASEGSDVSPDWKRVQDSIILALHKYPLTVWVDFDGADGSPSKQFAAKDSTGSTGKARKLTHPSPPPAPAALSVSVVPTRS